jgi:hypothetical protein
MSCALFGDLASDRIDGHLTPEQERALDAHLALCRECAEAETELALLPGLLRAAGTPAPPDGFDESVFAGIEVDSAGLAGRWLRAAASLLPRPGLVPSTALVALALVALIGLAGRPIETRPQTLFPASAPAVEVPREASLLTVWNSQAETIVATVDPTGITARRAVAHPEAAGTASPEVVIFLFERIVVRG